LPASVKFERLSSAHDRAGFTCEQPALVDYLQKFAGQNERGDLAACYVAVDAGGRVVGYYTLSAHAVLRAELSDDQAKGIPRRDRIPAFLIGRLARDTSARGTGLGELLLMDALARLAAVEAAGCMVVVDPIDENARAFYERYGFKPLGRAKTRLYVSMKTVRKGLGI
jgi:ribosomal protein S18 acetylase RimI-like enzyme